MAEQTRAPRDEPRSDLACGVEGLDGPKVRFPSHDLGDPVPAGDRSERRSGQVPGTRQYIVRPGTTAEKSKPSPSPRSPSVAQRYWLAVLTACAWYSLHQLYNTSANIAPSLHSARWRCSRARFVARLRAEEHGHTNWDGQAEGERVDWAGHHGDGECLVDLHLGGAIVDIWSVGSGSPRCGT